MQKEIIKVFGMSAEEVAKLLVFLLGDIKLEIIEDVVKKIGLRKVALVSDTSAGAIKSALNRKSIGRELAYKIFKGLATEYPEILKYSIDKILLKYENEIKKITPILQKIIDNKIREEIKSD